ncbi:hypothetical protein EWM64_g1853 [Hericium alpestre]|uniref:Amine oxidase domain-containing protein n=1 Tax=Hericium alpestre TaxID=135208 RepID=A0A4Z0A5Z7_9AGAM|nr:hypothetical protein EWM64_g1853 [Hericium alpestre]
MQANAPHALVKQVLNVGIVGGGAAGLYAALLLQSQGHLATIYEASGRVGGRIYTYHFTEQPDQYFEAGAMRIPPANFQKILLGLIEALNNHPDLPADMHANLITYYLNSLGNKLFVNGVNGDGDKYGDVTPAQLNWPVPDNFKDTSANTLLESAVKLFAGKTFDQIVELFDDFSFRYFLKNFGPIPNGEANKQGWPDSVIDFVETVCSQTNQFALSCPELYMQYSDFLDPDASTNEWHTIDKGMDRLPQAMAHLIGLENIVFGARVQSIAIQGRKVVLTAEGYNGLVSEPYDRVILAIPPAALKMIAERPRWSPAKEMAIRSMNFESLYKMGLRFKTRFWETTEPTTKGGQSTTDLPIRWIVYPSNGIDNTGPGVLLVYSWMTDASTWLPLTPLERRSLALQCLNELYRPTVDVYAELMETFDVVWSSETATGDAMFLPGQFKSRFDPAVAKEGNVYFAGEHLSQHHTWIAGALESALNAVQQMLGKGVKQISKDKTQGSTLVGADKRKKNQTAHPPPPSYLPKDPLFPHYAGLGAAAEGGTTSQARWAAGVPRLTRLSGPGAT